MKYFVWFCLFSFCGIFFADEVVLEDDTKITGEITMFSESAVEIVAKDGKTTRKARKKIKSFKFDNKLDEEFFQKLEEAGTEVEKIFDSALWAFQNKLNSKYQTALLRCIEFDAKYDKAGELLGFEKNADGVWKRPAMKLKMPKPPSSGDLKRLKKTNNPDSQPTEEEPEEDGTETDPERKALKKKAYSAWKKIDTKFKMKQYEAIREDLEQIAKDFPEMNEGKKAQNALDHWQELIDDRELDPIRQLIRIEEFTTDQVQFRTFKVPSPELRLEFSLSKDLDELGFRFMACKKVGTQVVFCLSDPAMQVYIDVEKKKGHKLVSTLFSTYLATFGTEFLWGRYEMYYKGKLLFSGETKDSEGQWWLDAEGKQLKNEFWLGWYKASEANVHTHPWQSNTLWTSEESSKRPGYKPKKK